MTSWVEIRPVAASERGSRGGAKAGSRRQAEGEAWRAIVRENLGSDIAVTYNWAGAPILPSGRGWIGVSHTRGWVAVVWSPEPCAIDIELKSRALRPATAARYNIGSIAEWCALEARYKYRSVTATAGESIDFFDPAAAAESAKNTTSEGAKNAIPEVTFLPHPELVVAVIR